MNKLRDSLLCIEIASLMNMEHERLKGRSSSLTLIAQVYGTTIADTLSIGALVCYLGVAFSTAKFS